MSPIEWHPAPIPMTLSDLQGHMYLPFETFVTPIYRGNYSMY